MSEFIANLFTGERDALVLLGTTYLAVCGFLATGNAIRLSRWPSVFGALREAQVERTGTLRARLDEQEYAARVRYGYAVDGVEYEGERLSPFLVMATYNARLAIRWKLGWIDRIGVDGVRLHHHPTKPQTSHLIGVGWRSDLAIAGLCLGAAAILFAALP